MSSTEMDRLTRDCAADEALRGRIAGDVAQATAAARAAGYAVTEDEIGQALAATPAELTGRQLDAVAGGAKGGGKGFSH